MSPASATATGFVLARPDVAVRRRAGGVWVGVGSASFTVRGAAAADLVTALLDRADGTRTASELLQDLPPAAARLLEVLTARDCAVLLDAPMSRYADEPAPPWLILYFAQLTRHPERALRRMRDTVPVLYGRPSWLARLRHVLDGVPADYRSLSENPADGAALPVVDADGLPHGQVVRIQDALRAAGRPHGIAGSVGSRYWLVWSDGDAAGCWDCLRRHLGAASAGTSVDEWTAAGVVAHSICRRAAGLGTVANAALSLDPDRPEVRAHPAVIEAGCRCRRARRRPAAEAPDPVVRRDLVDPHDGTDRHGEHDRIVAALAGWTDPVAGPFLDLDGGELPQVPYGRARATVLLDGGGRRPVHAAALSSREALYQAALNAVEVLAGPPARNRGAGWTLDEAIYRALLRSSARHPAGAAAELPDDLGPQPCVRVSRYLERSAGLGPIGWTGERLPNGLYRVAGRPASGPALHGLGACYAEAVATALLGRVNDDGVLVPVNPHFRRWRDAWQQLTRPDVTEPDRAPVRFTQGRLRVVELA
ncbi:hypothetical protein ACWT_3624 [Actinoplanes sp. SE50]|uniref:hypothetical protein n=1 Tax=unclassified Actinoplanes TaxID=2626549 RepID=UPI00023EC47C|nr:MULTISPECIES: hypothetical protein [unclassified Actinoplanes]AEV84647.1 hypothetical protein ACPL_3752 [Actinoplanes sp. SE50/110]ATO83039.1 hypothetical protein ACWT_3624 [Actinoplanes sp. SE50]SLM00447.1 hypothetical protein ACSP50_3679 [Actinoplanes sp. SE50/110]